MKENTTDLKRYAGRLRCAVSAAQYIYFGHLTEWVQQDGASVVTEIPCGPSSCEVV